MLLYFLPPHRRHFPDKYTITASAGPNGTISPSGEITVAEGASKTFTITPDEGYKIADVIVDENSVGAVASYTFDTVEGDHSITASFEKIDYTVAVSPAQNGEVTADKPTAQIGDIVTITATPTAGYELDTITVTAEKGMPVTVIDVKFTMPADNVTVSAAFKKIDYAVKIDAGIVNGTVAASAQSANVGDAITLTVTPETGYQLKTLTVVDDSQNSVSVTGNKFTMPAANVTVSAEFEKITYTVAVSQAQNGEVTTDKATAQIGDIVIITATPSEGFELDTITVTPDVIEDSVTVTDGKFTMPADNVTVTATFKLKSYIVDITGVQNGTVTSTHETAKRGDTVTLTAEPHAGHIFNSFIITPDAGDKFEDADGTFVMPAANISIALNVTKIKYNITALPAVNGTVTLSRDNATVNDIVTVTAKPQSGYQLKSITIKQNLTGDTVTVTNGRFAMPADNVTVTVLFSVKPVAPPSGGGGGSSTPSTPQTPSTPAYETHVAIVGEDGVANFPSHEIIFRVTVPEDYEGKIEIIDRASVDTPDGMNVYHQADIILHDEIDEGEIVLIHFEIPLSVLEAKGLGPEDACLYHYDEVTGWTKLTTWYTVVGDTVIYDAEADAFSPFAIVFEENSAKLKGSEPVTPPTEDPTDEPETPFPVLGILAGLGAAVALRRK